MTFLKKISKLHKVLLIVLIHCLLFFLLASHCDKMLTSSFNDLSDVTVLDASIEDCSISYSANTVTLIYRYKIQNNSQEDRNICLVGLFPENRGDMCISREMLISNDSYYIAAGETEEIEVIYTSPKRYNNSVPVDYVPETHFVEAK